jgi:hypothetical protein
MLASLAVLLALQAQVPPPPSAGATGAAVVDDEAPIIEDVAAAASSPEAPPAISVLASDRGSGVARVTVYFRGSGSEPWRQSPLSGGSSGLFVTRLPDGLQATGFDYYVEATDNAGNPPARIGSAEAPIHVEKATRATRERLEEQRFEEPPPQIHPAWLMLSLGVGVLAGAGAGAYAIDLSGVNNRLADVGESLARTDLTPEQRTRLEGRQTALQTAAVQDTTIATVLGVVGAAGLVTGTVLVVIASLE